MPKLAQRTSKGQLSFPLRLSHRILSITAPCSLPLLEPSFLTLCHSPGPIVCSVWGWGAVVMWDISLYKLLSGLKTAVNLSPLVGNFSQRRPVFPIFSGLSLFFNCLFYVLRTRLVPVTLDSWSSYHNPMMKLL